MKMSITAITSPSKVQNIIFRPVPFKTTLREIKVRPEDQNLGQVDYQEINCQIFLTQNINNNVNKIVMARL